MNIGETVVVQHRSDGNNIIPAKKIYSRVAAFYLDGRVRVTSGDVWKVKRINHMLHTCL